jgi:Asp-tRNA(Asn)/Glu-tRNA(Gln) amidotransferase A subunit family amidase
VVSIMCYEGARAFAFEHNEKRSALGTATVRFLDRAAALPAERYRQAKSLLESCRLQLGSIFASVDALMTPSAECEAAPIDDPAGDSVFNRLWTGLHVPCVTLPLAAAPSGLPIGLQLIGQRECDAQLLAVAETVWDRLGPRSARTNGRTLASTGPA